MSEPACIHFMHRYAHAHTTSHVANVHACLGSGTKQDDMKACLHKTRQADARATIYALCTHREAHACNVYVVGSTSSHRGYAISQTSTRVAARSRSLSRRVPVHCSRLWIGNESLKTRPDKQIKEAVQPSCLKETIYLTRLASAAAECCHRPNQSHELPARRDIHKRTEILSLLGSRICSRGLAGLSAHDIRMTSQVAVQRANFANVGIQHIQFSLHDVAHGKRRRIVYLRTGRMYLATSTAPERRRKVPETANYSRFRC